MVEPHHHLNYLRVECNEKGTFPNVTQIAAFKHCQHCENPKCMDICPTLAISKKDTGAVVIDADKCIAHFALLILTMKSCDGADASTGINVKLPIWLGLKPIGHATLNLSESFVYKPVPTP